MDLSPMQEWYTDRCVFITGATGFMGKVLLEKILRDLPTVRRVYILARAKRGLTVQQRWEKIQQLPLFDRLRTTNSSAFGKVRLIEGDLSTENLGLNQEQFDELNDNVSVVFHMGASLRLEAGVKDAMLANMLGTKYVLDVFSKMKNIACFVHLSTAFCHVDVDVLEERLYKPNKDPFEVIEYIQSQSDDVLEAKKEEIIHPHPNSYTFSKRMSEGIVLKYADKMPIIVARPSIVIPSWRDPVPGWVDTLNGPVGVLAAAGKGVLRSMLGDANNHAEVVPVDVAINLLILMVVSRVQEKSNNVIVCNVTSPRDKLDITWGEVVSQSRRIAGKYPFEWMVWYPEGSLRTNIFMHWLIIILFQWIPAILIDFIFLLIGRERFMIRVQKKIMVGLDVLQYFTMREWSFEIHMGRQRIREITTAQDMEIFYNDNIDVSIPAYMEASLLGVKKFCFKENPKNIPLLRLHYKILFILHHCLKYYMWYLMLYYGLGLFGFSDLATTKYWFKNAA